MTSSDVLSLGLFVSTNGQSSGWSIEAQLDWPAAQFLLRTSFPGQLGQYGGLGRDAADLSAGSPGPKRMVRPFEWGGLSKPASANPQPSANLETLSTPHSHFNDTHSLRCPPSPFQTSPTLSSEAIKLSRGISVLFFANLHSRLTSETRREIQSVTYSPPIRSPPSDHSKFPARVKLVSVGHSTDPCIL